MLAIGTGLLTTVPTARAQTSPSFAELRKSFVNPPDDARPMVRWWWFGPAVVDSELGRELDAMHQAGIGGVELAAEYPLALDDPAKGIRNLRYGSPEYVAALRFAQQHARALGMRVDLTLGSGWPFGGPEIPLSLAAGRLRIVTVPLGNADATLPKLAEGEQFIAAFVAQGTPEHYDAKGAQRVGGNAMPTALEKSSAQANVELFFIASHTHQQVKRAAFGGEGFVLDHMAKPAIEQHLHVVGDALLGGFADKPPYAIFSDSLEAYASDWTPDLPAQFRRLRGYDLTAHLPELAQGGTPEADALRHDWGVTLSDLVRENYLTPVAEYAAKHGTRFRSQTYGEPAVTLADEHIPQLPEGEGPQWRSFSFTRWASSANHVYGNPVTSAETWTWLHSPAFRATPLDMKVEADRMFLEGVNQIIGHGFPYSAPGVQEPGWSLYAAAALNDHNPWWPIMPDVTRYLTRVSWALRQGQPANDVAILLPEADAQAAFRPGHVSVTEYMVHNITPALMGPILDAGYNVDYVDVTAALNRGLHYPVVVIPPTTRISLAGAHLLQKYVQGGGKLIFIGTTPSDATGLVDAKDAGAVRTVMSSLVQASTHIPDAGEVGSALVKACPPDITFGAAAGKLGFLHRHLAGADIYFIANTSPDAVEWTAEVRSRRKNAEWWNPDTGAASAASMGGSVTFAPYASRMLILSDAPNRVPSENMLVASQTPAVGLKDWTMAFPGSAESAPAPTVQNTSDTVWSDLQPTKFYSGEVRYTTKFHAEALSGGEHLALQFEPGTALPDTQPANKPGIRAWFDAPVRDAAIVMVNGKQAGALWHPPYSLDVSPFVHAGENTIELRVFNTAINGLAGQSPRDYTALKAKYGDRFQMQDMDNLQPITSGIVGPVRLVYEREASKAAH